MIKIFSPKERPYGPLSNNSLHRMYKDQVFYNTVTNFIYSNIISTSSHKDILRIAPTKDVLKYFNKLKQETTNNIILRSISTALQQRFIENDELKQILLLTENSRILYCSKDLLLGTGKANDGKNHYGTRLMQLRMSLQANIREAQQIQIQKNQESILYDTYLAEKTLTQMMKEGKDITNYQGMTSTEIINQVGREQIQNKNPTRGTILNLASQGKLPDIKRIIKRPQNLVLDLQKRLLKSIRFTRLEQLKEIIFNMYSRYLLKKEYPDIQENDYKKAIEQQLSQLSWQEKNNFQNRLYNCYDKNKLSKSISKEINRVILEFYVPSLEKVIEAEAIILNYDDQPQIIPDTYINPTGEPILVYPSLYEGINPKNIPFLVLSPISTVGGMIRINSRCFPTVCHYIMFKLFESLPTIHSGDNSANIAYNHLLIDPDIATKNLENFKDHQQIYLEWEKMNSQVISVKLKEYAKEGMNLKFDGNRSLQNLLLCTDNMQLKWADYENDILGIGSEPIKRPGQNIVGIHLMELRTKYKEAQKLETFHKLTTQDITTIIETDEFMITWIQMRVNDMCKTLTTMKLYLFKKDEINMDIDDVFTTTVLDNLYQPCSHLFEASLKITAEVPPYFVRMVENIPGMKGASNVIPVIGDQVKRYSVVELIWKRIAVLIYYLIEHIKNSTLKNIRCAIAQAEFFTSKAKPCIGEMFEDQYDNCAASAIINLLYGIVKFNQVFAYDDTLTELDVYTAAQIILNADISDQIKPIAKIPPSSIQEQQVNRIFSTKRKNKIHKTKEKQTGGYDDTRTYNVSVNIDELMDNTAKLNKMVREKQKEHETLNNGYSPGHVMLVDTIASMIDVINDDEHAEIIARTVEAAVEIIKTHHMTKQIKQNRINFFATMR